ncbi:MAG: IS21 family transposase [Gammaproteobacteria bacterium]|nr:IS21 family transposase [Gammaproteobacteria bacterium]
MNKHRECLRLIMTTHRTNGEIAKLIGVSTNTVRRYRLIIEKTNLSWTAVNDLDDTAIEFLLKTKRFRIETKHVPDWASVHRELQLPHVTLQLLWEEYRLSFPDNTYSYSQFTHYYRQFVRKLDVTMRQTHRAGECVFVDFAGSTIPYINLETGEELRAQIFVGVLGASNYTFAYAVRSQSTPDWIDAHNRMYRFFGGVPQVVVPDNLKAAVICPGNEPVFNRTYLEQSKHYRIIIVPARVRKPKDKSKAEGGVLLVSRWVTARLRHRKFFSIEEINAVISGLLRELNERPFKRLPDNRHVRFEQLDKPLLQPLPGQMFEYAEWTSTRKIGPDYHFCAHNHHYSVPHELVGEQVEARVTGTTVELFCRGRRIATHVRSREIGGHTTTKDHQPQAHRHYAELSAETLLEWAKPIGEASVAAVQHQFDSRPYEMLGIGPCVSLKKLAKDYGHDQFEAACKRAQRIGSLTVKSIRSILQRGLTDADENPIPIQVNLPLHDNVRGPAYYSNGR